MMILIHPLMFVDTWIRICKDSEPRVAVAVPVRSSIVQDLSNEIETSLRIRRRVSVF